MSNRMNIKRSSITGLSLIELMIAMVIGIVLLLGLVQVMSASRTAYQLSAGVARTQENARFAMDSIQRDLRMVGHLGCENDQSRMQTNNQRVYLRFLTTAQQAAKNFPAVAQPLRFDMGIQGFDDKATAPGKSPTLPKTPVAAAKDAWEPSLPDAVVALRPVANSDVLVVRYFAPAGVGLLPGNGFAPTNSGTKATITPASAGSNVTKHLKKGDRELFALADCENAAVFSGTLDDVATGAVTFASGVAPNQGVFTGLEAFQPALSTLYRAESLVYYVALGAGGGPSLFRARVGGTGNYVAEELVEGVESLQLLYGRDFNDPPSRPSGYISQSTAANGIGGAATNPTSLQGDQWRRVGMVQVGLLMRSPDRASAKQADATRYPSVLGVTMTPPDVGSGGDGLYRSVYETTVALRNRLYGG